MRKLPTYSRAARRGKSLAVIILVLIFLLTGVLLWRIAVVREKASYHPPEFAENVTEGVPSLTDADNYGSLETKFGYSVALCAVPACDGNSLSLYLTNPSGSGVLMMAEVLSTDGSVSYGRTGLIREGYYQASFNLTTPLPQGASFALRLYAFEPDTFQSEGTTEMNGLRCAAS